MPEGDDERTSDEKPSEEKSALRPTFFSPPPNRARKKTRVASAGSSPTNSSDSETPTVLRPTAIPGVERLRIRVTTRDLKTLSPAATAEALEQALSQLSTFVAETATERKAVLWGHELQKSYSTLVTATLAISQSPLLRKVEGYLGRMIDILGAIDVMAVCTHRDGALGQLFKSVNNKIDTPQELNAAQAELDQLTKYLGVALNDLLDLRDTLQQHSAAVNAIGVEIEASALAALFLSRHLENQKSTIAERFTERSMSLTQTLAQIRSGDSMRELQLEQPIRMVRAVQDVALVMMPGFLGGIASALALISQKRLTPTQAGELTYQLRDILQQLRT